ncbi:hypothetical protein M5D10_14850 [Leptospira santarosai]|nr:hypothetical protein [Leptospira santarosai]UZN07052.1 hypothetical protein M5D10_14850 [Leptospira santarosai]
MTDVSGKIKYGCLWGMLTPFLTLFVAVGITIFVLKDDYDKAQSITDWTILGGKHIFLFGGIVTSVIAALILGLWFAIEFFTTKIFRFRSIGAFTIILPETQIKRD